MSRKGKNNHYHYAEKFEAKARMSARDALRIPKKSIIFTMLFLLAFGLISTTFAAYVTDDTINPDGIVSVRLRNTLSERRGADYVDEFADAEEEDLADSGAEMDLAESAATTYYYRGGKNSWGATAMTASSDGFYAYYSATVQDCDFHIFI